MDTNAAPVDEGIAPTTDEPIPRDIYNATNACRWSLQGCQSIKALMHEAWAENRLADFNLWATGVGASAGSRASLDWRLHFQPDACVVLTNLLVVLKGLVEQCKDLGLRSDRGEPEPTPPEDDEASLQSSEDPDVDASPGAESAWIDALGADSEDEEPLLQLSSARYEDDQNDWNSLLCQAMKHAEDVLDQLIRLGYAIRKSGGTSRLRKADGSFKEGDHKAFRNHLGLVLLLEVCKRPDDEKSSTNDPYGWERTVKDRALDPETSYYHLNLMQQHIVHANLRRRHRFLYARRHQEKLGSSRYTSVIQAEEHTVTRRSSKSTQAKMKEEIAKPKEEIVPGKPEMTTTTASAVEGDVLRAARGLSQTGSRVSVTVAKLSYPSPPPAVPGMRSFKCPCCFQTLPDMFRDRSRWRKHLSEDLSPYTCPFSDCPEAASLYTSRGSWMTHISKRHIGSRYWECLSCAGMEKSKIFDSGEDFETHLRRCHGDTIAEPLIPNLREWCCRTEPPSISSCPLCYVKKGDWDSMDWESRLGHVGDCIHEFSLRALPWAQWPDREVPAPELREAVHAWLAGAVFNKKSPDLAPKYLPPYAQNSDPEERFLVGEYFDEVAEGSSRLETGPAPSDMSLPKAEFSSTLSSQLSEPPISELHDVARSAHNTEQVASFAESAREPLAQVRKTTLGDNADEDDNAVDDENADNLIGQLDTTYFEGVDDSDDKWKGKGTAQYSPGENKGSGVEDSASVDHDLGYDGINLDPRYRIETPYKFQPGEVFKTLWPEPLPEPSDQSSTTAVYRGVSAQSERRAFVRFKRFIVIANDAGHCTCVEIVTYGGKGCKKRGVKPEKHGIISEKGTRAKRLKGEPRLGYPPVRIVITAEGERLARESRVNYSKIVTIEHNIPVFFIGSIYDNDYDIVADAVNDCWEKESLAYRQKQHLESNAELPESEIAIAELAKKDMDKAT